MLAMILLIHPTFGQESTAPAKNELGISLLSYASRPSGHLWFDRTFYAHPVRGVNYKRHLGRSAIRLAVARQQLTKSQPTPDIWTSQGDYEATIVKIGWERSFTTHRLSPYAAIDLTGIRSFSEGSFGGGIAARYHDFTADRWGLGLSPALGIRYRPLRWMSLFAETSLDIIYSHRRGDYTKISLNATDLRCPESIKGFEGKFNPLATLAINLIF